MIFVFIFCFMDGWYKKVTAMLLHHLILFDKNNFIKPSFATFLCTSPTCWRSIELHCSQYNIIWTFLQPPNLEGVNNSWLTTAEDGAHLITSYNTEPTYATPQSRSICRQCCSFTRSHSLSSLLTSSRHK